VGHSLPGNLSVTLRVASLGDDQGTSFQQNKKQVWGSYSNMRLDASRPKGQNRVVVGVMIFMGREDGDA